jgi:ArsR family transcriptional regulator, arsenate/arsenite/antimonite-responsive transcriptional repressor
MSNNLNEKADLFKALGHPARLMILNLAEKQPRHGEELAVILNLSPATISHHLSKLVEAGLLTAVKSQYYQTHSLAPELLTKTLGELIRLPPPTAVVETDAYRAKVLKSFFRNGRLTQIPAQLKKQQIVLERLAEEFELGRDYPEQEVNRILLEFHEDVAALRRGFIDRKLMSRERGVYRRL